MQLIVIIILLVLLFLCFIRLHYMENETTRYKGHNIYVKNTSYGGKYGRGVFAGKDFDEDEIIEKAPYIEDDNNKVLGTTRDYLFGKLNGKSVVAFGYASIYNHMDNPNAIWDVLDDYMEIKATRPIKKDEEIFVSYGDKYWETRPHLPKVDN